MIIKKYRTDYISQAETLLESFGIEAVPTIEYTGSRGEIWVDCPVGFLSLDEELELIERVYRLAIRHGLTYTGIHFDAQIYS